MKFDSIIFDLDGTLWNSADAVAISWNIALEREGVDKRVSVDDFYRLMGKTMDVIAADLFPDIPLEASMALLEKCSDEEKRYIAEHGGKLFPGLERTLERLSKDYRLFIVSNCQCGYIEVFFETSGLGRYFEDYSCWGMTGLPKGGTNRLLIEKAGLQHPVYVGDTDGDRESALQAGIPFVFARYGFGNVKSYDYVIDSIEELPSVL